MDGNATGHSCQPIQKYADEPREIRILRSDHRDTLPADEPIACKDAIDQRQGVVRKRQTRFSEPPKSPSDLLPQYSSLRLPHSLQNAFDVVYQAHPVDQPELSPAERRAHTTFAHDGPDLATYNDPFELDGLY